MAPIAKNKAAATSRSRNTTPMSGASSTEPGSATTSAPATVMSYAEIGELCRSTATPTSTILKKLLDGMKQRSDIAKSRSSHHDMSFRDASKRKDKELDKQHELEVARSREEEELKAKAKARSRSPIVKEQDDDGDVEMQMDDEQRPPAVGARGVARQDGVPSEAQDSQAETVLPTSTSRPTEVDEERQEVPEEASDSVDDTARQPRPAPARPQYQTFGPDPSTFDDPTIYHIRPITAETTKEEKLEILGVTYFPEVDLFAKTCGIPPDKNLENAKPANQTSAHAFAQYLEPYFRKFTEDDVNWLKERGDRMTPMIMPPRGAKSYKEVWADEDNDSFEERSKHPASHPSTTQAHGSIEQMSEDVTETNDVSIGPMLARLLQCMRPERRGEPQINGQPNGMVNGDSNMTNGVDGDVTMTDGDEQQQLQRVPTRRETLPPATALPEAAMAGANSRAASIKPSWAEMDDRVKQELRYIGFLSEDAEPDYDSHFDDDIAARLRWLQEDFQSVSVMNGARKARLLQILEDAQASDEYNEVMLDMEGQLNQAYSKRHRNTGKGKGKLKRAGAAASYEGAANGFAPNGMLGVARPGVGATIRELMDRHTTWSAMFGKGLGIEHMGVPQEGIFDEAVMKDHMIREKEAWVDSQEP